MEKCYIRPGLIPNSKDHAAGILKQICVKKEVCMLQENNVINNKEQSKMRIAIPLTEGILAQHFGHCQQFAVIDVNSDSKSIENQELLTPPAHEPAE